MHRVINGLGNIRMTSRVVFGAIDDQRLTGLCYFPHNSLTQCQGEVFHVVPFLPQRHLEPQPFCALIKQQQ